MKDVISKSPTMKYVTYGAILLIVLAVIIVLVKIFKGYQTGVSAAGDIAGAAIIQAQTNVSPERQEVCKDVAVQARAAMTITPVFDYVFSIDDDAMTLQLNRLLTTNEVALFCQLFKQYNGFSIASYIKDTSIWTLYKQQARLNPIVLNNLV